MCMYVHRKKYKTAVNMFNRTKLTPEHRETIETILGGVEQQVHVFNCMYVCTYVDVKVLMGGRSVAGSDNSTVS